MIRKLSVFLFLGGISMLAASNLSATACMGSYTSANGHVKGLWAAAPPVNGLLPCASPITNGSVVACPQGGNCGYKVKQFSPGTIYYLSDSNTTPIKFNGWHSFTGGTQAAARNYLNNSLYLCSSGCIANPGATRTGKGVTFSLNGSATLGKGDNLTGIGGSAWRAPINDTGYFLTTPDNQGITIQFGIPVNNNGTWTCLGCISHLYFYWGSTDPWNEISLKDYLGNTTTFTGWDFNQNANLPYAPNLANTASTGFEFDVLPNANGSTFPWQSVTFLSCGHPNGNGTPDCTKSNAAFEFDNLQWSYPATCCGPIHSPNSPTPEPSSTLLLGTGIAGIASVLKRRLRI